MGGLLLLHEVVVGVIATHRRHVGVWLGLQYMNLIAGETFEDRVLSSRLFHYFLHYLTLLYLYQ